MANRRLIDKNFILSDSFTKMTARTQLLYIRLLVSADDEGFVSNIRMLCRNKSSLNELINAGLLHQFDTGCALVLHWFVHNSIRKDRKIPTQHTREKALVILDEDQIYRLAECQPNDNQMSTQDKINKDNIYKDNLSKDKSGKGKVNSKDVGTGDYFDDFARRKQDALRRLADWSPA